MIIKNFQRVFAVRKQIPLGTQQAVNATRLAHSKKTVKSGKVRGVGEATEFFLHSLGQNCMAISIRNLQIILESIESYLIAQASKQASRL